MTKPLITLIFMLSCFATFSQREEAEKLRRSGEAKPVKGDYKGAISDLDKAIETGAAHTYMYFDRAIYKKMDGDYQGAIDDFNKSLETLVYGKSSAIIEKGLCKHMLKDYEGAIEDFSSIITPDLTVVDVLHHRALSKIAIGDFAGACADLDRAMQSGMKFMKLTKAELLVTKAKNCN